MQNEILRQANGAIFRRADLHIHSFGEVGSYDVSDKGMTPEGIVDVAISENLQVVAVTDHNSIGNVRRAVQHASGKPILVVPGVELSTSQGHLLVYCPTPEKLEGFYGKLKVSGDKKACHDTMAQCLKYADEFDEFGICAHIDADAGIEKASPKYDTFKQEVLNCTNLLGLEVAHSGNSDWFGHTDVNNDRRNCAKVRCQHLGHEEHMEIAKVMSSDAHSLGALGRNAKGDKRLTRFKMESLSFDSLRIALTDCAARVRLEDLIPLTVPYFLGMKLEGGFLKDQIVHFSRNLTCIIGGRGAGKSTMLESLRVVSGNMIESYGQGETAKTIKKCGEDPGVILSFPNGFLDLARFESEDEQIREGLLNNQTEIERLEMEVSRITDLDRRSCRAGKWRQVPVHCGGAAFCHSRR